MTTLSLPPVPGHCTLRRRGRTGFDSLLEAQTACRGWFVGLVKNRTKTNKRRQRRSRSRGLIDRDVFAVTPASGENVDSRLASRRSDRARFARSKSRTLGSWQCAGATSASQNLPPAKHVEVCVDSDEDRG